jgi:D-amino-acid dehydrogenase
LRLPIQPAKGYSITIPAPSNAPATPLHLSEMKVVVTPMGDKLRFAGTLELAGFDLSINTRRVEAIKNGIPAYLRLTVRLEDAEIWRGLRPLTPDTLPIIGRTRRYANLIIAAGHGMLGISLAPITGQLVAEIAARAQPSHDLTLLSPDRFA